MTAPSAPQPRSLLQKAAGWLASSPLMGPSRRLMERNFVNYHLPLSKWGKLSAGTWLILRDYADGKFPPTFTDQQKAYEAEMALFDTMTGISREENIAGHITKPFWGPVWFGKYARAFIKLTRVFEKLQLPPGARLLEMGCGVGWTAEFLAYTGYHIVGTTLSYDDIEIGQGRVKAAAARGLPAGRLAFRRAPMETLDREVADLPPFDGVFVFEALHHAFDWQATVHSAARCLKPGGWLLLANEPNTLSTFYSYRVGRLTNTHEIGMSGRRLRAEMRRAGLVEIRTFEPRINLGLGFHWIAARKPL